MLYFSAVHMHPCRERPLFEHLTVSEKISAIITAGGSPLAKRHWWMANVDHSLGHRIIAVIEYCPLLGGLFVIIEKLVTHIISSFQKGKTENFLDLEPATSSCENSRNYFKTLHQYLLKENDDKNANLEKFAKTLMGSEPGTPRAAYVADLIDDAELKQKTLASVTPLDIQFLRDSFHQTQGVDAAKKFVEQLEEQLLLHIPHSDTYEDIWYLLNSAKIWLNDLEYIEEINTSIDALNDIKDYTKQLVAIQKLVQEYDRRLRGQDDLSQNKIDKLRAALNTLTPYIKILEETIRRLR